MNKLSESIDKLIEMSLSDTDFQIELADLTNNSIGRETINRFLDQLQVSLEKLAIPSSSSDSSINKLVNSLHMQLSDDTVDALQNLAAEIRSVKSKLNYVLHNVDVETTIEK